MKILIVDDSAEKIGAVRNALKELEFFESLAISHALDLNNARIQLSKEYFDLLILDLNMPEDIGEAANMTAGIAFVDEVMSTHRIKKPSDIVVLSAFDESLVKFREQVEKSGFIVIQYGDISAEWKNTLKSRVDYLKLCYDQRRYMPRPPECKVLLVTAVSVETSAILAWDCQWEKVVIPGDPTVYRRTYLENCNGQIPVIHVQLSEMGMVAAASLVSKAIMVFQPQYVMMVGIAAGLGNDASLGDILVATDVWDYSSGKYIEMNTDGEKKIVLQPDPKFLSINKPLKDKLIFADYKQVLTEIKDNYIGNPASENLNVHFGQMACGVAVVASKELVDSQVKAHARKVQGLDMESYGIFYASAGTTNPAVTALVIKSISDFADSDKGDKAQPYAAYTSASFARYVIESMLDIN